jgi:fatty acid desaturase
MGAGKCGKCGNCGNLVRIPVPKEMPRPGSPLNEYWGDSNLTHWQRAKLSEFVHKRSLYSDVMDALNALTDLSVAISIVLAVVLLPVAVISGSETVTLIWFLAGVWVLPGLVLGRIVFPLLKGEELEED